MSSANLAPRRFDDVEVLIEHLHSLGTMDSAEDEAMTELDHGLQTAAILRQGSPFDLELVVAGLVHDLAHPWDGPGQPRHASMGANAVRDVLGDRVADLVLSHVSAKRYLVTTRSDYASLLSPDSTMTLEAQGGPMSAEELAAFEAQEDFLAMVQLRLADDGAKVPHLEVPPLSTYESDIRILAQLHRR